MDRIATLLDHWLDPAALAIVLGGTVLATLLRCGLAEARVTLARIGALARPAFDPARAKAEMARQIRTLAKEGYLRAEPVHFGDAEFDCLTDSLISRRSIDALRAEHEGYKRQRTEASRTAMHVLGHAAELAPVLGLAGTLVALGTMPSGGASGASEAGMTGAIAMAVVTTLYGLVIANLLFAPLAAAIHRRSAREERDRQAVLDWLENGVRRAMPHAAAHAPVVAEVAPHDDGSLRKAS